MTKLMFNTQYKETISRSVSLTKMFSEQERKLPQKNLKIQPPSNAKSERQRFLHFWGWDTEIVQNLSSVGLIFCSTFYFQNLIKNSKFKFHTSENHLLDRFWTGEPTNWGLYVIPSLWWYFWKCFIKCCYPILISTGISWKVCYLKLIF